MQILGTLRQLSLGDLADDGKRREERGEREERKIMPSLMATSLRWRTHDEDAILLINSYSHFREENCLKAGQVCAYLLFLIVFTRRENI
jgi:hypothetical protein